MSSLFDPVSFASYTPMGLMMLLNLLVKGTVVLMAAALFGLLLKRASGVNSISGLELGTVGLLWRYPFSRCSCRSGRYRFRVISSQRRFPTGFRGFPSSFASGVRERIECTATWTSLSRDRSTASPQLEGPNRGRYRVAGTSPAIKVGSVLNPDNPRVDLGCDGLACRCGCVLARLAVGFVRAGWLVRRAKPVIDETWKALLLELADPMGLAGRVKLLQSDRAVMPMAWGLFRPVVLLPQRQKSMVG